MSLRSRRSRVASCLALVSQCTTFFFQDGACFSKNAQAFPWERNPDDGSGPLRLAVGSALLKCRTARGQHDLRGPEQLDVRSGLERPASCKLRRSGFRLRQYDRALASPRNAAAVTLDPGL